MIYSNFAESFSLIIVSLLQLFMMTLNICQDLIRWVRLNLD